MRETEKERGRGEQEIIAKSRTPSYRAFVQFYVRFISIVETGRCVAVAVAAAAVAVPVIVVVFISSAAAAAAVLV